MKDVSEDESLSLSCRCFLRLFFTGSLDKNREFRCSMAYFSDRFDSGGDLHDFPRGQKDWALKIKPKVLLSWLKAFSFKDCL